MTENTPQAGTCEDSTAEDSTPDSWPAATNQMIVTLCRGMMLPAASRMPAKFNKGESLSIDVEEATALLADGYAVKQGDDPNLDETPVPVECLAPFSLRGKPYHAADLAFLPAWFVVKAKALELVGDPPAPKAAPAMKPETKQAIENRRIQRQRKIARDYLESVQ